MSATRYVIEEAKSGKAGCKKCKAKIGKGELRIGSIVERDDSFALTSWYHPACFNMPRKYATGAEKMTPEEFVEDILHDESPDHSILPAKADEIAQAIASKGAASATGGIAKKSTGGDNDDGVDKATIIMQDLKKAYETKLKSDADGDEDEIKPPKSKKAKKGGKVKAAALEAYGKLHKQNADALKDYLRWNRQVIGGKKDFVFCKVLDGFVHGRLALCPLDGGKLKFNEDCETVSCQGVWDESLNTRMDCTYRSSIKEAPRAKWFTSEPTEEEKEEMDKLADAAQGNVTAASLSDDVDVAKLIEKTKKIMETEWDLNSKNGMRKATADIIQVFRDHSGKKVDIPDDDGQARQKVGPILVNNRGKTAEELIPILVSEFKFVEDKEKKQAAKEAAMSSVCKCPKNAAVAAAFSEMASLIRKQGDNNRAAAYGKAAQAINDIEYEITEENALGLGKGKATKVKNIGPSTATKIHEFLSTGKIEALEELRSS